MTNSASTLGSFEGGRALLGAAGLVVYGAVKSHHIDELALNDWWTNEHLPERLTIPGFLRARRYCARDDASSVTSYLTLYETEDISTLTSAPYMEKLDNPTQGTKKHIPTLATMHRSACQVVCSQMRHELMTCGHGVGAAMVMLVLSLSSDDANVDTVPEFATNNFSKLQRSNKSLMAFHVLREDRAATEPGSASQSSVYAWRL